MLNYHGRIDSQIKIHGYRVELQEIEHVLSDIHPSAAIVIAWPTTNNHADTIYAFLLCEPSSDDRDIIAGCKNKLPNYMIPKKIFFLNAFPLNANGKINKKALQEHIRIWL